MRDKILCVGLVCVDVVQVCPSYPKEDTDQRCLEQYWQRGGNASNNCTVLSSLEAKCEYFGTVSSGIFCGYVTNDFETHNITIDNCVCHDNCDFPLSIVITNAENGSRTIIHANKNLPELKFEEFKILNLSCYSWVHFEGRNIETVRLMSKYTDKWRKQFNGKITISVELEKPRKELNSLIDCADVVFVGKDYALFNGYNSMEETINNIKPLAKPGAIIVSAWGEQGASAYSEKEGLVCSPANIQPKTVDTLGAGDTFTAAVIYALNKSHTLKDSICFGCQISGAKVGITGFKALKQVSQIYLKELQSKLL